MLSSKSAENKMMNYYRTSEMLNFDLVALEEEAMRKSLVIQKRLSSDY